MPIIFVGEKVCPRCGAGALACYDNVRRIVRTRGGKITWTRIRRLACRACGALHNELPDTLLPHKHYEADIIGGFVSAQYSSLDLEFEDYPSESTVKRWLREVPLTSV